MANSKKMLVLCVFAALAAQIGQVASGPVPQDTTREAIVSLPPLSPLCSLFSEFPSSPWTSRAIKCSAIY
jgi:hypothetical protein